MNAVPVIARDSSMGDDELATIPSQTHLTLNTQGHVRTLLAKTVRVHDDTHQALKRLKVGRRSASIDEVIREMIRESTGVPVEKLEKRGREAELTSYLKD